MGCLKRLFYVGIFPVALGVAAWQGWSWWSWANSPVLARDDEQPIQLQIPSGTAAQQIGQDLEAAGLIRSTTAWKVWNRLQEFQNREGGLQAGTYSLSPTQSMSEIADQIWTGDVVQTSFTIPEGWNRTQMAQALEAQGLVSADDFLRSTEEIPYAQFPWLPQGLPHLEGYLYPDTYQLPSEQMDADSIVDVMLLRFEQVALPVYQQGTSPYSLDEWVNLASIVEKESVVPEERDTIAGVFARRLREGISLGSDPTVEYGLGVTQTPERPLTLTQVNTPNPYNTYRNLGLPPTPIASPGIASLEAALNPPDTEFLYFVARYDGTHVFSRSLAEHERAQGEIRDRVDAQLGDDL
ncbi:endolytic transglycosylase MltG [Leptolyngbyaceae cyanobacterium CCMR0082]|uniref:Endolytic murein transglycosylase n=2 Tax=Adonisia turfae TaxID=2950184 RepID=A0A6M0SDK5_9CYAN|nr:endolytic transglycosylase MltG [Adonisia turfae]MDV3350363.1 endolytic transglycosylase MltG [Leptothoe sp. LEGE 181152]NEZ58835.1 endolytic transglycosylase MltG [Adonisia turfae CCMR0081]NEZ66570.1 endolytic transglycosylase MltG [Adonisia turfae CCMR0082]